MLGGDVQVKAGQQNENSKNIGKGAINSTGPPWNDSKTSQWPDSTDIIMLGIVL